MYKYFVSYPAVLLWVIFLCSCSSANNKPIVIRFSADSTAIVFSGINPSGLLQVRNSPGIDTAYDSILSVMEIAGDNDSTQIERPLPGKVEVTDSNVLFKPLVPFVSGKNYLVMSYMNVKFGDASMLLKEKLNTGVKSNQAILKR